MKRPALLASLAYDRAYYGTNLPWGRMIGRFATTDLQRLIDHSDRGWWTPYEPHDVAMLREELAHRTAHPAQPWSAR